MMRTIAPAKDHRKKAGAEFTIRHRQMREENPKAWCLRNLVNEAMLMAKARTIRQEQ